MHSQVYTEIVFKFACCSQGIQVTLIQKWILSFWGDSGYWIEKNQVYGGRNRSRGSLEFHRGTSVNKGVKGKARLSTLLSLFFLQNLKRAVLNVEQIVPSIRGASYLEWRFAFGFLSRYYQVPKSSTTRYCVRITKCMLNLSANKLSVSFQRVPLKQSTCMKSGNTADHVTRPSRVISK